MERKIVERDYGIGKKENKEKEEGVVPRANTTYLLAIHSRGHRSVARNDAL